MTFYRPLLTSFYLCVSLFCIIGLTKSGEAFQPAQDWWGESVTKQLEKSGTNQENLIAACRKTPAELRPAMGFLISNFNPKDLLVVDGTKLLADVRQAYEIRAQVPWGNQVPDEVFLNDVLPHFNVDESREFWRTQLHEICMPLVADCKSPAEAAQRLNEQLFEKVKVKYSTARKQANQSPSESIEQGLASCTGLSVLLTDACRSVGVPARLAGIPSWPNKRGNHTWVEIWDGDWKFTGAAEPDKRGLNHTWFQKDAALAVKDSRLNAIYAVSFRKTSTTFPLVWSRDKENPVYAVNVTDRYTKQSTDAKSEDSVQCNFRVWNEDRSKRIPTRVFVFEKDSNRIWNGLSPHNEADMNDMLDFELPKNSNHSVFYEAANETGAKLWQRMELKVGDENQVVDLAFNESSKPATQIEEVTIAAYDYFSSDLTKSTLNEKVVASYAKSPQECRKAIWRAFLNSPISQQRKSDFDKKQVTFEKHLSPYTLKKVGKRPKNGWPLFIAMHGGGGTTQKFNDSQWRHMQIYYKDQPQVTGYQYLALRAPNNTWNGFYDDYVYPLVENLIQQMIVFSDVDPSRIFIMGYSHGGYGAFSIGPKIPYRFAAIHSSAAAPTDGQTSAKTLRNTRFTFMVGENDTAFGRRKRCEKFAAKIKELKADRDDIYPVEFMFQEGYGHGGLPDRDMIGKMYDHERNAVPKHLTWEMTDSVVNKFFWLRSSQPAKSGMVEAKITDNKIELTSTDAGDVSILLDERLIDVAKPISLLRNGDAKEVAYQPSMKTYCDQLVQTGDPNLAFDFEIKP